MDERAERTKDVEMPIFREHPGLIERFREGNPQAVEQVYRYYVRQVDAYLCTLFRALDDRHGTRLNRADLLQEVFVRSFQSAARVAFDPSRPYGPYLRAIARNCFIDALRAERREVLRADIDSSDNVDDQAAAEPFVDGTLRAILTSYLGGLPAPLRGVYHQRYVLGRTQDAACAALGISRRTLRTNEEHLKRGLRKALIAGGVTTNDVVMLANSSLGAE